MEQTLGWGTPPPSSPPIGVSTNNTDAAPSDGTTEPMTMRFGYDDEAEATGTAFVGRGDLVHNEDGARRARIRSTLEFAKPTTHCS